MIAFLGALLDQESRFLNTLFVGFVLGILLPAFPQAQAMITEADWREIERDANYDPHPALSQHALALQNARNGGDKAAELKALVSLSVIRSYMGRHAINHDEERGAALARELGDMRALTWYLENVAWIKWHDGQHEQAVTIWEEASALAERYRMDIRRAWIYLSRGIALQEAGHKAEAMDWMSKAYAICEARQDHYAMALTLMHIGDIYSGPEANPREQEQAAEYYLRAGSLLEPGIHRVTLAGNYLRLGLTWYRRNDLAQAKSLMGKGLALAQAVGDSHLEANIERHLGNISKEEGRFIEALPRINRAMEIYAQTGISDELLRTLVDQAELLAELDRTQESLGVLDAARQALAKVNTPSAEVYFYPRAAAVYARLDQFQQAYQQMQALRAIDRRMAEAVNAKAGDELRVKFEVQLKETENILLRSQQKEAESRRLALSLALALSLLLMGGVAYHLRKRAAAARIEAAHHKALAAAEAAANQAKGTFLANMSHELRSPLNVMLGFAQLLMRKAGLDEATRDDLTVIYNSGQHLYTLINQVLDLSKMEAGHATLNEAGFDLYALLDELTEMFSMAAKQKGVQLSIDNAPEVPQYVCADALKLRQVLINLLNNAIKFTSEGGVALHVEARMHGLLSFAVTDTGPGIADDELAQLGSAFTQAAAGRQAKEGTGLGLAISASFVRLMGGELKLASQLGQGTTIAFAIPAQPAQAPAVQAASGKAQRVMALAPDQPRYRILAADDRAEARQLLMRLLTPLGFEVREAVNGEQAIAVWQDWRPHLIWMDWRMPVMDGREATQRIKATEQGKETIVIALTASSFEEEREQVLAVGCDDFLRKPFRDDVLFALMTKHLGVVFVYDEQQPYAAIPHDSIDLGALPAALKLQLREALEQLDIEAIESAIEAIHLHDPHAAHVLAAMTREFQYERILVLLAGTKTEHTV